MVKDDTTYRTPLKSYFRSILLGTLVFANNSFIAAVHDYEAVPKSGDTYTTAKYRIYYHDTTSVIKGIYHFVEPYNTDSRNIINNTSLKKLCNEKGFALMGSQFDSRDMMGGIGDAYLNALDSFAVMSSHPELKYSNVFFDGYSWGGQFAYDFMVWKPERVIGLITHKGGFHDTTTLSSVEVPILMLIGENDLGYRIDNLKGIFKKHRPLNAPWILAVEPGAGHNRVSDLDFLESFFKTTVVERVPKLIPINQQIGLLKLDKSKGWLGSINSQLIGEYGCFDLPLADSLCYFSSDEVAKKWQRFISDNTMTEIIDCYTGLIESQSDIAEIEIFPNPASNYISIQSRVLSEHMRYRIIDSDGREIQSATLNNELNGAFQISLKNIKKGLYFLVVGVGQKKYLTKLIVNY